MILMINPTRELFVLTMKLELFDKFMYMINLGILSIEFSQISNNKWRAW